MIQQRSKPGEPTPYDNTVDMVNSVDNLDYVLNGVVYKNSPVRSVLVGNEDDLDLLDAYEPGTFAFTAGFVTIWQKGTDGEWVEV